MDSKGENCGYSGDDAGDAGIDILDVIDQPQFFFLIFPQAYKRDHMFGDFVFPLRVNLLICSN